MLGSIRRTLRNLKLSTSGNATLLVAIGMPAMIGGSGLAVDTAQWYMWKRELQNATDQAALAGAWAQTDTDTQGVYASRAAQEYAANIATVASFDTAPNVSLANFGSGTNNSVVVTGSASQQLPFSSILTGRTVTVNVRSQATFTAGITHTACMLAIDPHADSAFKFGGSVTGTSTCGAATLSDDENAAMKEVGITDVPLGSLVATGGIDDGFEDNGTIHENQSGLADPYSDLATPSQAGSTAKTYSCPTATEGYTTYTATITPTVEVEYIYVEAVNSAQAITRASSGTNLFTGTPSSSGSGSGWSPKPSTSTPGTPLLLQTVGSTQAMGTFPSAATFTDMGEMQSSPRVREVRKAYTNNTYSNLQVITVPASDGIARPTAGIYDSIAITCETQFGPGIYFVNDIDFGQNMVVTGSSVLFVITSSSGRIGINSNSNLTLSGITAPTLTAAPYNYDASYASKLKGMVFWDKESDDDFVMNGNSALHIDGTFYMPYRTANFLGDSYASGGCMMVAARKIDIQGNFDVSNFCIPDADGDPMDIGGGTPSVKLVA